MSAKGFTAENFDRFVSTLPMFVRGPRARQVIQNMALGGARLRLFMPRDARSSQIVMRTLGQIADTLGASPRVLRARTSLGAGVVK